jgi:hypothetical protein
MGGGHCVWTLKLRINVHEYHFMCGNQDRKDSIHESPIMICDSRMSLAAMLPWKNLVNEQATRNQLAVISHGKIGSISTFRTESATREVKSSHHDLCPPA